MTQKVVIEVSVSLEEGKVSFQIEQKQGDLMMSEVARTLKIVSEHMYKTFQFLEKGDGNE